MMKFAEIVREAGLNTEDVPHVSQLPIILYDSKRRAIEDETIKFVEPLFKENPASHKSFFNFCTELEQQLASSSVYQDFSSSLSAQISESALILWYDSCGPYIFLRHPRSI
ncbi:MAG: hypothetical protein HFJ32_01200 [Clostridia bacterium]|nr:hypothetical protein [Clostridia bacterium]